MRKTEILLDYISSERRWFTSNDNPDRYKAAKMVINDIVEGALCWLELPYSVEYIKENISLNITDQQYE